MRIFCITISLVALLISNSFQRISAIVNYPEAELFTIESGMSQTRVNISFADSYGYLWIGTSEGLNRFDGYKFKIFKHIPYDSSSLSQNFIRCIAEDKKTNLWIGTDAGLNFYDRKSGKFRQFIHNPDDSTTISDNQILSVYADNKGYIWVNTERSFDRIDPSKNNILHFHHSLNNYNNGTASQNSQIIEDLNGNLWFGNSDGLFSFNPETYKFANYINIPSNSESLSDNEVLSIYKDKNGTIWVGTKNGLNKFNPHLKNFQRYLYYNRDGISIACNSVNTILEDKKGVFWLGCNKGLILFDQRNSRTVFLSDLLINKSLFSIGLVNNLFQDKSGIIWMSGFQGLFKIDTKLKKFSVYNTSFYSYPSLSGDMISCVFKESNELIWLGIWDNGLNILNRKTGEVEKYYSANPNRTRRISSNKVRCLLQDHTGTIWLGSINGLDIFDPATRSFIPFREKYPAVSSGILNNRRIICITEDNKGDIWLGTDKGILRFQRRIKLFTSYNKIYNDNITTEMNLVFALAHDKNNKIWIGTDNGLNCYDPEKDLFYRYEETGKIKDLSSRIIYSLFFDSHNALWIGTTSGLNRFNPQEENFDVFTEADGLSNDLINAILEDDNYCLWLSTNKGLSRYDIRKNEFTNFDLSEGLQSFEYNHSVARKALDGEMFFGGIAGLNSFYPKDIPLNPYLPEIVITSYELMDYKGLIKEYSEGEFKYIQVNYNQSFTINFAALDFTLPAKNQFEYSISLKGKEEYWILIRNQNSLTFSNLPQGEYILRIRGSNSDLVWNKEGTVLFISSRVPFWRKKSVLVLYFLFSVYIIYSLFQFRTKSLRRSNRVLRDRHIAAKEISRQKDMLTLRNKNIEDSLNYAQRIQKAILTTPKQFRAILPNSFVFHKPKDIVSGDFYWISEQDGKIFVAAADCTGHGVPGAFMSLISFELFRKIIKTEKVYKPSGILNEMNKNFEEIFGNVEDIIIRDGMDLSFCVFDKAMQKLEFSGAFNPLYIVRDNKLIQLKGDHLSIGADIGSDTPPKVFTNHSFLLEPNDMIYMFSDGYADQFGGTEGKKFKYLRFRHLLLNVHQLPLDKQKIIIEESIEEWKGNTEQVDDILVIGIRIGK
jgi:ligand-binding sensor domain-containing protein/serine phosphatase RsbU (regulator of sigma subunit)